MTEIDSPPADRTQADRQGVDSQHFRDQSALERRRRARVACSTVMWGIAILLIGYDSMGSWGLNLFYGAALVLRLSVKHDAFANSFCQCVVFYFACSRI